MKFIKIIFIGIIFNYSAITLADDKYEMKIGNHVIGTKGFLSIGSNRSIDKYKKSRSCYKLKDNKFKYVLGNECENSASLGLYDKYYLANKNSLYLLSQLEFKFRSVNQKIPKYDKIEAAYIELGGINSPINKIWFGKRKLKSFYIELFDSNLVDVGGNGFGISDLKILNSKFQYAYLESDKVGITHREIQKNKLIKTSHDFRLTEIPINQNAQLSLWFNYAKAKAKQLNNYPIKDGYAVGIFHEQQFQNLFNRLSLQYGQDLMSNFKNKELFKRHEEADHNRKTRAIRITNNNNIKLTKNIAILSVALVEITKSKLPTGINIIYHSIGVRPSYKFNDQLKLSFEMSHDIITNRRKKNKANLTKITLALDYNFSQNSQKKFNNSPLARAFITTAKWNKNIALKIRNNYYNKSGKGTTMGVQLIHNW